MEFVELGGEGVGEDVVVVDEFAIGAAGAVGDAPAEGSLGAGEDFGDAVGVLEVDGAGVAVVTEAPGIDDGDEAPADLAFFLLAEFDGDDAAGEGAVEHGVEALANAGGVDDEVAGVPGFGEAFDLAEDGEVVDAGPGMAGDDVVGGALEGFEGGEVDGEDGEGGGVAAGIAEAGAGVVEGVEPGFVHTGDIEEEGVDGVRVRPGRNWIGFEEEEAGGGEHGGLGVDGFAEVLGADEGVAAAAFGDDAGDVEAVGGEEGHDVVGGVVEDALDAVLFLFLEGNAALTFEEGIGGPGGAPEDAGGVGGGGHGVEVLVELGDGDVLGFVDGEEEAGGGTDDAGGGFAGEELEAGLAEVVGEAAAGFPEAAGGGAGVEDGGDAAHVVDGLGGEGGGDGDEAAAGEVGLEEGAGEEVGLDFVLAGLAGEDGDEGEAEAAGDRGGDGADDAALVGVEVNPGGEGEVDRVPADLEEFVCEGGEREMTRTHGELLVRVWSRAVEARVK